MNVSDKRDTQDQLLSRQYRPPGKVFITSTATDGAIDVIVWRVDSQEEKTGSIPSVDLK